MESTQRTEPLGAHAPGRAVAVVLGAVVGALAGSAVGFVAGGSLAMRGPGDDGRLEQNVRADAHRRTES